MNRMLSPDMKARNNSTSEALLQVVMLEKQIKEMELKIFQMNSKLKEHQEREQWMHKFIVSFVDMAE